MNIAKSYWFNVSIWFMEKVSRILWLGFVGIVIIAAVAFTLYMRSLPSLYTWHTTILQNEFALNTGVDDFDAYLALEDRLFNELETEVYAKTSAHEKEKINRYTKNSISDPRRWEKAWNRTFELPVKNPKMGALLIHGLSDSPYSLRAQAQELHKRGVWVVAMRMPGHGTVPSGLIKMKWQEMAAVVKIGMEHLHQKVGNRPIHMMGYSTGGPLALNYTLRALQDPTLTLPESLIFFSPAVGVSKAAPLAIWQSRLGHLLGLPKLEWNAITPEYDPFKYGSFAVNAGDQVYRICNEVQEQLNSYLANKETKRAFPPVLSFASIVDATVSVDATINNLYKRLPKNNHTLVLFDINHDFNSNHLVKQDVDITLQNIRKSSNSENYTFELISNIYSEDASLMQITNTQTTKDLNLEWPKHLYSLSHLAMPMSSDDPLYGNEDAPKSPGIQLGHLAFYGETSVLQTSASALLRQRWNPFHDYTNERVFEFMGLE